MSFSFFGTFAYLLDPSIQFNFLNIEMFLKPKEALCNLLTAYTKLGKQPQATLSQYTI